MRELLSKLPLDGYKTYICIAAAALVLGLAQLGYVEQSLANTLIEWITVLGGVSLVHKVDKVLSDPQA